MYRLSPTTALALIAALLFSALPAAAADPAFKKPRFVHVADKQPIAELLRSFGASQGWNMVVSGDVEGTVSARFSMPSREFWTVMTAAHNLIWYYDGQFMHVNPASDLRTEVIPIGPSDFRRWQEALVRMEVADTRLAPRYDTKAEVALLSGPPRYTELARSLWAQMENGPLGTDGMVTRLYPLNAAMAADQVVTVGGQALRIEGVVSVVRRVMGLQDSAEATPAVPASAYGADAAQRLSSLRNFGAGAMPQDPDRTSLSGAPLRGGATGSAPAASTPARRPARVGLPRVEADSATNAIIVRDRPERLFEYQRLVEQLDRVRPLVEIEARMVEVERDELEDLGIDLSISGRSGSLDTSTGAVDTGAGRSPQIVATLLSGTVDRLLARVRALEGRGRGSVVTPPRLLTLDRTEASIESTETAYIKVAGNLEANLFSVQAGSSLRIVPAVMGEAGQRRIRMVLNIEDGILSETRVDNVPVVQRQRMFTQSEIAEGASLLVGGLTDVRERSGQQGVPGLSRVPILGHFFGRTSSSRSSRERLYLITPRILPPLQAATAPVAVPPAAPPAASPAASPQPVPAPPAVSNGTPVPDFYLP